MKDKEMTEEDRIKRILAIILLIFGVLFTSFIVYFVIVATTGEVDTHMERFKLCNEKGYEYMKYIKGDYANCCRGILRSNVTGYYLTEECIKLEIPK